MTPIQWPTGGAGGASRLYLTRTMSVTVIRAWCQSDPAVPSDPPGRGPGRRPACQGHVTVPPAPRPGVHHCQWQAQAGRESVAPDSESQ